MKNNKGFSLVEILVALALLGIVFTLVVPQVAKQFEQGKYDTTKLAMRSLIERVKAYKRDCNRYPTTEQGLDALINKPVAAPECKRYAPEGYLENKELPKDAWDTDFYYESDGRVFELISFGADQAEGGEGFNADISSNKDL